MADSLENLMDALNALQNAVRSCGPDVKVASVMLEVKNDGRAQFEVAVLSSPSTREQHDLTVGTARLPFELLGIRIDAVAR